MNINSLHPITQVMESFRKPQDLRCQAVSPNRVHTMKSGDTKSSEFLTLDSPSTDFICRSPAPLEDHIMCDYHHNVAPIPGPHHRLIQLKSIEKPLLCHRFSGCGAPDLSPQSCAITPPQSVIQDSSDIICDDRKPSDVMLSYCRKDTPVMILIKDALNKNNVSSWIDIDRLSTGGNFLGQIGQAIINCKIFVMIVTEQTIDSKFCVDELTLAYISNKVIFPVCLQPWQQLFNKLTTGMKLQLASFKWNELNSKSFEADMALLVNKIQCALISRRGYDTDADTPLVDSADSPIRSSLSVILNGLLAVPFNTTSPQLTNSPHPLTNPAGPPTKLPSLDFWQRNFGAAQHVSWIKFQSSFLREHQNQLEKTFSRQDCRWYLDILKRELQINHNKVNRTHYTAFTTRSINGMPVHQSLIVCLNHVAAEQYTLSRVFDMESTIRLDATTQLNRFDSVEAMESVLDLLDDTEGDIRASACISLAKMKADCLELKVSRLIRCLRDKDRFVRESTCVALGYLGTDCAVADLLHVWRNDYISAVRDAAELALRQIGGSKVERAMNLTRVLTDEIDELIKVLNGEKTTPKIPVSRQWSPMKGLFSLHRHITYTHK